MAATSIYQIAAELGVSYSLVSKVLSGNMGTTTVSAQKKEMILAKAKELNFMPNRLAVALKSGSKGSVAVFLHDLGVPGSEMTKGLLSGLAEGLDILGLHMWLRFFTRTEEFFTACSPRLRNEVDGLIVAGVAHPELASKFRDLEESKIPVVCGFGNLANTAIGLTNVTPDIEMQGYLPAKHLLDLGCRDIVCLATFEERTPGYLRALKEAGIKPAPKHIFPCVDFETESGVRAVQELLRARVKMDGIVCQSDAQAVGVIHELHRRGVRVPEDVKVTGVDDSPLARACLVPITSVTSEMHSVGRKVVELLDKKQKGRAVNSLKIQPSLVVRASTAKRTN